MALVTSSQPSLRGQVVVKFPANVIAGHGITISKDGQTYIFEADTTVLVKLNKDTPPPEGGDSTVGILMTSSEVGIYVGSGLPTLSAAKGSIYLRTDGDSTVTRMYTNIDGGELWAAFVSEV